MGHNRFVGSRVNVLFFRTFDSDKKAACAESIATAAITFAMSCDVAAIAEGDGGTDEV